MKSALYARIVFGASAILFGVIALMWHDADTWQTLHQIWRLPFGRAIGNGLMIAQIAGGAAILYRPAARLASLILAIVYLLFSAACVPDIIAAPATWEHYGSFFEQFTLLSGATALYAATMYDPAIAWKLGQAARFGIGLCATSFTLSQIIYFGPTATLVPRWIPPSQSFWAILTTIAFGFAAIAIFTNRSATLATRLMALMLASFGVIVWILRVIAHPETHFNWSELALTFLITGATATVAESR